MVNVDYNQVTPDAKKFICVSTKVVISVSILVSPIRLIKLSQLISVGVGVGVGVGTDVTKLWPQSN